MRSQVTGGLEIQKNPAKKRVKLSNPSFSEGPMILRVANLGKHWNLIPRHPVVPNLRSCFFFFLVYLGGLNSEPQQVGLDV